MKAETISQIRKKEMALAEDLLQPTQTGSIRDGFGKGLLQLGEENANVWALSADVMESTRAHWFAEKFPKRFVQIGIAEQNMAGVAAGIALCGKTAFISSFAAFSPGRNWDQVRVSICYTNVDVKLHASHAGLTVGPDGATHQAMEDIGMLRALPNMVIVVPCDMEEARKATLAIGRRFGPAYVRTSRERTPTFTTEKTPFELGKANVYREGGDAAIFACGMMVYQSLVAAEELEKEGISCAVIDCHTIKPIDREAVKEWTKTGLIVSVEEHQINGGLGSAIAEVLAEENANCRLYRHGMPDAFGESGKGMDLLKKYKLDAAGIADVVREAIKQKKG